MKFAAVLSLALAAFTVTAAPIAQSSQDSAKRQTLTAIIDTPLEETVGALLGTVGGLLGG